MQGVLSDLWGLLAWEPQRQERGFYEELASNKLDRIVRFAFKHDSSSSNDFD